MRNAASLRRHPRAGLAYHVFTNDRRARVGRRGERTAPEVALLTVGDSFSWGHGVENPETYTARLAARWDAPAANLAFSAYGTVQSLQMLRRNLDLRPRLVVYGFIADHMKRNVSPCAPAYGPLCLPFSHVGLDDRGAPVVRRPDPRLFAANRRFWDEFFFAKSIGPRQLWAAAEAEWVLLARTPRPEAPDDAAMRARILEALIGDMAAAAASVPAPLVVLNIPYLETGSTNPLPAPLREAVGRIRAPNLLLLDLAPLVARHHAAPSAPPLRFERDRHPNAAAHDLIAGAVAAFVQDRRLLDPVPPGGEAQ
ncbi:MAG TPA: hypothetical protein VMR21_11950 [Vicinamibacteria bacterium]|nr:hypothetical protein [Vicinamibacteria bacterium]